MHEYTMNKIGEYIKENYCPDKMTRQDLDELYLWSKSFKNILEGDYYYNMVSSMENTRNYTDTDYHDRMYFSSMEQAKPKDLDDIYAEITDMTKDMNASEKATFKTKLTTLVSKIS